MARTLSAPTYEKLSDAELREEHARVLNALSRLTLREAQGELSADDKQLEKELEKQEKDIDNELDRRMREPKRRITLNHRSETREKGFRSGEVGLKWVDLFGSGDMAGYETRESFWRAAMNKLPPAESRTMIEGGGVAGGFTVPSQMAAEIWNSVLEESVCLEYCRMFRMNTGTLYIPAWDSETKSSGPIGAFEGSWLGEAEEAGVVTPSLRLISLWAQKLGVYVDCSREVLQDSLTLAQQLGPTLTRSLAYTLDEAIISGSGLGQPLGILNSGSRITVGRTTAGQISFNDVISMFTRLYPAWVKGAVWLVSPSALEYLCKLADPSNHYLWIPAGDGFKTGIPGSLLGIPVRISEKCKQVGTEGDLILCNLGTYAYGLRQDFAVESSTSPQWSSDLVSFRCIIRCNGQPLMGKVITPKSGNTLSWAVTLA